MSSNEHESHGGHGDYHVHAHITSTKLNLTILGALFLLTGTTLAAYEYRLGDANLFVALVIAMIKATLVGTFFMHLKWEKAFNVLFFVGTLAFIGVFFFLTYNDTSTRGETDYRSGRRYDYRANEWAQGVPAGIIARDGETMPLHVEAEGEGHAPAAEHH